MIDDLHRLLLRCEELIDRSGVAPLIEDAIGAGGRPRQLPVRTLLVGLLMTARRRRPLFFTETLRTLLDLSPDDRVRLGVEVERGGACQRIDYRNLAYTFEAVMRVLDPEPVSTNRRKSHRALADADAAACEERLSTVCDRLLEATIPDHLRDHPHLAIDWTDADSWATGMSRQGTTTDPNAAWGRRRSRQPGLKDALYFGYGETLLVMVPAVGGPPVPGLVRRMDLERARDDHAWHAVEMLRRMQQEGHRPGDLLGDNAYSHRVGLTREVTRMGYQPTFDLHPADTGPKGTHQGAVIADGSLFCAATPVELIQIKKPKNNASPEEQDLYRRRLKERDAFRARNHAGPDLSGNIRMTCPGHLGNVRCEIAGTMHLPPDRPEVLDPPNSPPPCCTKQTFTVPPEVADKTRQAYPFRSPKWHESFNRRTAVERAFGSAKDRACEDVSRGRIRLMGRAKQRLMRTIAYMSVNERLLERFEARSISAQPATRTGRTAA